MRTLVVGLAALVVLGMPSDRAWAEEGKPSVSPMEIAEALENCWNWMESLSDFQPYLPAKMPPPKQMVHLNLLTARKCKLRGHPDLRMSHITDAQARLGDKEGLLDTFREFDIDPKDQVFDLATLTVVTKSEPIPQAAFGNDADLYRNYCTGVVAYYWMAGQFDKSIEIKHSLFPGENDDDVVSYASAGQFDKALEILASLRAKGNAYQQEHVLASYLLDAGKIDEARKLLPSYLATVRKLKKPDQRLDEAIISGAEFVKRLGDTMQRRTFLEECEHWEQEARAGDVEPLSKASGASSLARIGVTLGDNEFAKKHVSRAIEFARGASEHKAIRLAEYASFQASLGQMAESKQTAKEALAVARANPDEEHRDMDVGAVAGDLAWHRNETLISEIDAALSEIRGLTSRTQAICGVVKYETEHEQWERAKRHLAEGRDFLRRQDIDRAEAWMNQLELDFVAVELAAKQGDKAAARKLLVELSKRSYWEESGDFSERVFDEQCHAGFLEDAWRTAIWLPDLGRRLNALGEVTEAAVKAEAKRNAKKLDTKGPAAK
jgi:tetratricopeptide (TPR) repeat protein